MVLVDANVLLDLVTAPNAWSEWSLACLREAAAAGPLLANDVIFAEVSIGFEHLGEVERVFAEAEVAVSAIPRGRSSAPERHSATTAGGAAAAPASCRTSSSARMPRSRGFAS